MLRSKRWDLPVERWVGPLSGLYERVNYFDLPITDDIDTPASEPADHVLGVFAAVRI